MLDEKIQMMKPDEAQENARVERIVSPLPCPFCGEPAIVRMYPTKTTKGRNKVFVQCEYPECPAFSVEAWGYTEQSAIKKWNIRNGEML